MFTLAHISDPHIPPMPIVNRGDLMNKRALGYFNWQRRRSAIHHADTLETLVSDLKACPHDHIAITGDLVNIAHPVEYPRARAWLENLGSPADVTLVPGNHDAYVREGVVAMERNWAPYMRGDDGASFPFVRRRGPIAIIGLSSAVPTLPFMGTGRLGGDQLAKFETLLAKLGEEGLFRVVMIHHPPVMKLSGFFKRLTDSAQFRAILERHGTELLLHGHDHARTLMLLNGRNPPIPSLSAPSASAAPGATAQAAGYNLFEIAGKPGAWRCTVVARVLSGDGTITSLPRYAVVLPQTAGDAGR